jgi:formylglycine-generating enzyme required for sulfatase activity
VGRYAVTFDEWDAAVAAGGVSYKPHDSGWGRGRRPVINVNWDDAQVYCTWLSMLIGQKYRLLSECEWEYACRAGTTTKYTFGDTITKSQSQFSENVLGSAKRTTESGAFMPNEWGLYDLHGNVWEWCEDCWSDDYNIAPAVGTAWRENSSHARLLRGGSWYDKRVFLRSAVRYKNARDYRGDTVGFRVARNLSSTTPTK